MSEKKTIANPQSEGMNPLQAVRQRELELDQLVATAREQAETVRNQADQQCQVIGQKSQRQIESLEQEARKSAAEKAKTLEDQDVEKLSIQVTYIAQVAESHMEETVQFLLSEVLPKT
jgi:vacuolar-type H+-ATPase subunit H